LHRRAAHELHHAQQHNQFNHTPNNCRYDKLIGSLGLKGADAAATTRALLEHLPQLEKQACEEVGAQVSFRQWI
jgi:hypothetical protein